MLAVINTLFGIWLVVLGIYYLLKIASHVAVGLPMILVKIITLPVMPYIVAYRNREEHPFLSKGIIWMYSIALALCILIFILDTINS